MSIKQGSNYISGLQQDITSKANVSLNNLTATGKEVCANMAMPSDRYIKLTAGASDTSYTAPADGYFYIRGTSTGGYALLRLNYDAGEDSLGMIQEHSINDYILGFYIPVRKNKTVFLAYNNVNITSFRFYYTNGAQ